MWLGQRQVGSNAPTSNPPLPLALGRGIALLAAALSLSPYLRARESVAPRTSSLPRVLIVHPGCRNRTIFWSSLAGSLDAEALPYTCPAPSLAPAPRAQDSTLQLAKDRSGRLSVSDPLLRSFRVHGVLRHLAVCVSVTILQSPEARCHRPTGATLQTPIPKTSGATRSLQLRRSCLAAQDRATLAAFVLYECRGR